MLFLGRDFCPCIGFFFCYYPLKGWIHGKILCEFGFVMEYFVFPLCCTFPSIILCRDGFVVKYCLNLVLSWNALVSPSMVVEFCSPSMVVVSFAGYISLGWHLCSFGVCMTST